MGQIKDIIDKRYKEIANKLISHKDKDYFDAKAPDSESLPHPVSEFDDCNEIFYIMLEEVSKCAELQIDRGSLFDFFGGHFFIDFGGIDTSGDIVAELLKAADFKRIASILYYAHFHRWFDEELEEQFREVVYEIMRQEQLDTSLVCFVTKNTELETFQKQEYLDEIISEICSQVFKVTVGNPNLDKKYRRQYLWFMNYLKTNTKCILKIDKINFNSRKKSFTTQQSYKDSARCKTIKLFFKTLNQCYEESGKSMPLSTYRDFFWESITPLAGFTSISVTNNMQYDNAFILTTMTKELNMYIKTLYNNNIFKRGKEKQHIYDKKEGKEIFTKNEKTITSINDILIITQLYQFYSQMLTAKGYSKSDIKSMRKFHYEMKIVFS